MWTERRYYDGWKETAHSQGVKLSRICSTIKARSAIADQDLFFPESQGSTTLERPIHMSDTIRWGILGTGKIARQFAQGLRILPDARLRAVGSRTTEQAAAFATQFNVPHRHSPGRKLTIGQLWSGVAS